MLRRSTFVLSLVLLLVMLASTAVLAQQLEPMNPGNIADRLQLAEFQAAQPVYQPPTSSYAAEGPMLTDRQALTEFQAVPQVYQAPAPTGPDVRINNCLDLAEYQATLPYYQTP